MAFLRSLVLSRRASSAASSASMLDSTASRRWRGRSACIVNARLRHFRAASRSGALRFTGRGPSRLARILRSDSAARSVKPTGSPRQVAVVQVRDQSSYRRDRCNPWLRNGAWVGARSSPTGSRLPSSHSTRPRPAPVSMTPASVYRQVRSSVARAPHDIPKPAVSLQVNAVRRVPGTRVGRTAQVESGAQVDVLRDGQSWEQGRRRRHHRHGRAGNPVVPPLRCDPRRGVSHDASAWHRTRRRDRRGRRRRHRPAARRAVGPATGSRPPSKRGRSRSICAVNGTDWHAGIGDPGWPDDTPKGGCTSTDVLDSLMSVFSAGRAYTPVGRPSGHQAR